MAPIDPHSFTDSCQPLTSSIDLALTVDFSSKRISGVATLHLEAKASGELFLDTRDLAIEGVVDGQGDPVKFEVQEPADPIKGSRLTLFLEDDKVSITYQTSPSSSALQWLAPPQTGGGRQPFVFSQCQALHARAVMPCQDTPRARIRYTASVDVPKDTRVVMSAAHLGREEGEERAVEKFAMEQPIPPYLLALAAGDIVYEDISPRTRVYAEPCMVKSAAFEFAETEAMIQKAESLFGPYDWERFDILVMPPSFPYGGMENPRMTFLTPTVIAGDRSLVGVVAHELAHSWTGNLVSNATAGDFWLNEGWTTYAERRIQEAMEGPDRLDLYEAIGFNALKQALERFEDKPQFTKLKVDMEGVDPDEVFSTIPYEKGYLFLKLLEKKAGRPAFDEFIHKYIKSFRFQSISTENFLEFLIMQQPEWLKSIDLLTWIHGSGLPEDAPKPESKKLLEVQNLATEFVWGKNLQKSDYKTWQAAEWQIYLETLPQNIPHDRIIELDNQFSFSTSKNWELRVGFLTIAANSGYEPAFAAIEETLMSVGRMKYLRPLFAGLINGGSKLLALEIFEKAKPKYHAIAAQVIEGLLKKEAPVLAG